MIDGEKMISPITQMKNHCSEIHTEIVVIIELLNNEAKKEPYSEEKMDVLRRIYGSLKSIESNVQPIRNYFNEIEAEIQYTINNLDIFD